MPRISNALYARGYSREYADNVEADRLDRAREDEKDRQLEAAARLRDAAPALLEALQNALEAIEYYDRHEGCKAMLMQARAAIAKATNQ